MTFIAPRSPFHLVQEDYADDPWRVVVVSMLVSRAMASEVRKVAPNLFSAIESPSMNVAWTSYDDGFGSRAHLALHNVERSILSLGLAHIRARRIVELSIAWRERIHQISTDWNTKIILAANKAVNYGYDVTKRILEKEREDTEKTVIPPVEWLLRQPGVGPYVARCHEIFNLGIIGETNPTDESLAEYWGWAKKKPGTYTLGRFHDEKQPWKDPHVDPEETP